jgi:O-antigen/teichoic acid export membrane protein
VIMNLVVALKCAPWMSFRLRDFDTAVLERTWKASLGYFVLFVCVTVVYVQVPRLMVFHFLGAAALATFAIVSTYTRAARMFAMMISQPAQVEIGRALACGHIEDLRRLIETILGSSLGLALILLPVELAMAPVIIPLWTRGQVPADWDVLIPLALVALVGTYFDALMAAVAATNRVTMVALGYGLSLCAGLLAGTLAIPWFGAMAVSSCLLLPELGGSLAAIRTLQRVIPGARIRTIPLIFRL